MSLLKLVKRAATDREKHFTLGRPMIASEGFKEANIAHDMNGAFRSAGYYAFPEFHFQGGSIDAVFVRDTEVVVCEWKRLHPRLATAIAKQTKRMLHFDAKRELYKQDFPSPFWKVRYLWVCDAWNRESIKWGLGKPSKIPVRHPFEEWQFGNIDFQRLVSLYVGLGDSWIISALTNRL